MRLSDTPSSVIVVSFAGMEKEIVAKAYDVPGPALQHLASKRC